MIAKTLQDMDTLSEVLQFHETSFVHLKDKAGEALQHFSEDLWYYVLGFWAHVAAACVCTTALRSAMFLCWMKLTMVEPPRPFCLGVGKFGFA